jgi:hypothetical protein
MVAPPAAYSLPHAGALLARSCCGAYLLPLLHYLLGDSGYRYCKRQPYPH